MKKNIVDGKQKLNTSNKDLNEAAFLMEAYELVKWSYNIKENKGYWTGDTLKLFGLEADLLPKDINIKELFSERQQNLIQSNIQALLEGISREFTTLASLYKKKEATLHWIDIKGRSFVDKVGTPFSVEIYFKKVKEFSKEKTNLISERSRYEELIDFGEFATLLISLDSEILNANFLTLTYLNRTSEFILGQKLTNIFPSHEKVLRDVIYEAIQKKTSIKKIFSVELPMGNIRFHALIQPLFDKEGSPYAIQVLAKNIMGVEEELKTLKHTINLTFDGICTAGFDGYFKMLNMAFPKILGFSVEELMAEPFINFVHPNDIADTVRAAEDLTKGGIVVSFENRYITKSGNYVWLSWNSVADVSNQTIYAIARDVTQQKKEEEYLKMLESVVVNTKDAVLITEGEPINSPGPVIVYANEAFTKMTGYTPEEVIGKTPRILQGEKTSRQELDKIREALEKWQPVEVDLLNYRKDGSEFWNNFTIVPVANEDGWFTHWISIQRDVTEDIEYQKVLEEKVAKRTLELERSNQKLEQFASVASHDMKAPLRMVYSYLQLLKKYSQNKLSDKEQEFLYFAIQGAKDLQTLIAGILEFSQIQQAPKEEFRKVDLNGVVEKIKLYFSEEILNKNADITVLEKLPVIHANPSQIERLFQNFIGNSLKFQKNESIPKIEISFSDKEDAWLFKINDNGVGMRQEQVKKVFELFHREHGKKEFPGHGIGLAVCKEIVQNHGGDIFITSEVNRGTSVIFTLKK